MPNIHYDATQTDVLLNFVGFGNPSGKVCFIGMEEGFPRKGSIEAALNARLKFAPIEDLKRAHEFLHEADPDSRYMRFHTSPFPTQSTWRPMCEVMLRLNGNTEPTITQKRDYQANQLGRTGSETLLTELLPLPAPDTQHWQQLGYTEMFEPREKFASRETYRAWLLPKRIELLRKLLIENPPSAVICYGSSYNEYYRMLFRSVATWRKDDVFTIGNWLDDTTVILSPHFTSRMMNGKAKVLAELARRN